MDQLSIAFPVASEDLNNTTGNAGYAGNPANIVVIQESANAAHHQPPPPTGANVNIPDWKYCWTYGLGCSPFHCSDNCRLPAKGHQVTATLAHMMGGYRVIYTHGQCLAMPAA
jgi:hypothetical protein